LHTTVHFDGYRGDERVNQRLEEAVDEQIGSLAAAARPAVRVTTITGIWPEITGELRRSHALVPDVITADRSARDSARNDPDYINALMGQERSLIVAQLADCASVLGSIWLYEWTQAGRPGVCLNRVQPVPRRRMPGLASH
jgi:hypothetical protein